MTRYSVLAVATLAVATPAASAPPRLWALAEPVSRAPPAAGLVRRGHVTEEATRAAARPVAIGVRREHAASSLAAAFCSFVAGCALVGARRQRRTVRRRAATVARAEGEGGATSNREEAMMQEVSRAREAIGEAKRKADENAQLAAAAIETEAKLRKVADELKDKVLAARTILANDAAEVEALTTEAVEATRKELVAAQEENSELRKKLAASENVVDKSDALREAEEKLVAAEAENSELRNKLIASEQEVASVMKDAKEKAEEMLDAAAKQSALQAELRFYLRDADELTAKVVAREKDLAELEASTTDQKAQDDAAYKLAQMDKAAAVSKIKAELRTLQVRLDEKILQVEDLNRSTQSLKGLGKMATSRLAARIRAVISGQKQLTASNA